MRVAFSDFYGGFEGDLQWNPITAYFVNSPKYEIVALHQDPELIVCSTWGNKHTKYPDTHKIMWTAENLVKGQPWSIPPYTFWDDVDWTISSNHRDVIFNLPTNVKHYYLPYAGVHHNIDRLKGLRSKYFSKPKTKFCCFVSTAQGAAEGYKLRYNFFKYLNSGYKHVDSAGKTCNNVGYFAPRGDDFFEWISDYKFMICFENSLGAGYLTEKIFAPYTSGTIPIYWGDQSNFDLLRREACIEYTTPNETLARIMLLDQNPVVYENFRKQELYQPIQDREDILSQKYLTKIYDEIMTEIKS